MKRISFTPLRFLAFCCFVGAMIITAGCLGQSAQTEDNVQEDNIQTLIVAGPADFDSRIEMKMNVYDVFLDINANGKPIPGHLVSSWNKSDDGLTYTFQLNKEIEFHDGTQWNASSASWFLTWCSQGPRKNDIAFSKISDVSEVDEYTIQVTLKEPYGAFIKSLSSESNSHVIAPTSVEPAWSNDGEIVSFIGTGKFEVENYVKAQSAEFVRHDPASGEGTLIDRISYRVIPDSYSSVSALRAGDVDIIGVADHHSTVPYEQIPQMMDDPDIIVEKQSYGRYQVVELNCKEGSLSDIRLREAINLGLDRDKMVKELLASAAEPAYSVVSPTYPWAGSLAGTEYTYDPEKAKNLLDQAGWVVAGADGIREKDGQKLTLTYIVPQGEANSDSIAVYIQSELKKIGVDVDILVLESGAAGEERQKGNYDMYLHHSWGVPGLPEGPLTGKYHSTWGSWPVSYHDEELDQLIETAIATGADEDYSAAYLYIQEKYACMPLYDIEKIAAYRKAVKGFTFSASIYGLDLSTVSIEP
ncbi:Oligopeptide ABC transporter, periplasmic oligopeptide-binding protein OppA [Methanosarcina siciliae T4/M]|uniref:Oligopeptide ABC transporter, periplasmic oligopeptide-binding protein OppA n=2 Tax=Methanosarcina siciliae TaxID=38027 RepID=A0A0E3PI74_9EURY|nr:ABC transporter substrate-binding protein [Methanosarcina siciliae]AKB29973.1 Oligopeptide ABC transporter, periplasmic oligopeptide-binding protein OppA [Methanosarcina siciliae T4/M]AKB33872.1 Oligopeptide ABC transporter, periplasmic oligopeptide-binding protein OppA [Methanosarcina siciliae HI350]